VTTTAAAGRGERADLTAAHTPGIWHTLPDMCAKTPRCVPRLTVRRPPTRVRTASVRLSASGRAPRIVPSDRLKRRSSAWIHRR
jgi:hypothetical protein